MLALLSCTKVFAADMPRIAVSTFDTKGNVSSEDADIITELFITEMVSQGVNVIDRANFDKILAEMKFQTSDWSDSKKTSELGKVLNATAVIRGQIMQTASNVIITATMLDVATAKILSSARTMADDIQNIYTKTNRARAFNYGDYINELCTEIKAKLPEPEPILGTWRTETIFCNYRSNGYDNGYVSSVYFAWSNSDYRIISNTKGECMVEFKNDGTFSITRLTYPTFEVVCPKVQEYTVKETMYETVGSGFWKFTGKTTDSNDKTSYRNYLLQVTIDGKNYSMDVRIYKNDTLVYNVFTKNIAMITIKNILSYPETKKINVGTDKQPSWKYQITDSKKNVNGNLHFINWIKISEPKEEESK